MMHVDLGYNPHNVMSVGIPIHEHTFPTWAERSNYFTRLRDRIATLPDVLSTGISTNATPPDSGWDQPVELKGKTASEDQKEASTSSIHAISALWEFRSGTAGCGTMQNSGAAL